MAKHRDSTAAELLAELPDFYKDDDKLSMSERQYRNVLVRFARAEQALADIEALHAWGSDECDEDSPCRTAQVLAALGASYKENSDV